MVEVKAHRRVPWDKRVNRGNPTQEGEQAGEKTFGDFGSFQSHSPSRAAAAKPVEDGVLVSRMAKPCHLGVGQHSSGNEVTQPLTLALSRKGRGYCCRGRLRFANRPYTLIGTLPVSRKGRGDCCRGAMRSAYCTLRLIPWWER